jgi:hypothetical protein
MKMKDIQPGQFYILGPPEHSNAGCSAAFFENKKIQVIAKFVNYDSKNNLLVQFFELDENPSFVAKFWCSSNDLKEIDEA